ncbi:hypothetical protein DU508_23290 [Pedobacter chinensis]|uniref:Uncharacterized protein n=1 Tax=Pedobacter chinensis TaxID=2282421 RepID=A0A369PPG4_9SPHI|nr:hypothetical protein DU508_23290 [Pedobacter chinensis]
MILHSICVISAQVGTTQVLIEDDFKAFAVVVQNRSFPRSLSISCYCKEARRSNLFANEFFELPRRRKGSYLFLDKKVAKNQGLAPSPALPLKGGSYLLISKL